MGETVKVVVRCRPMNRREKDLNCECVVEMNQSIMQCSLVNPADKSAPPKLFTFDGVYGIESNTEQMYNDVAYSLVESVTEGYNGTVFAYGQTGCGKSFTMSGIPDPPNQRGIIPRAFEHIFETTSLATDKKFLVAISYLEIYNEEIRDLLGKDSNVKLEMKEHPEKGVFVAGLSLHTVSSFAECEKWLERGAVNRHTGATLMNADSSRSHSVFTCQVEAIDNDGGSGDDHLRVGKLNLVDLAGSERQSKTGATGDRLKEATKINLSLSALGNVISALVDGKSKHIPYRDSKLTRLLQDSLGGNTKTLMIAALSPADNNYEETLSTLRYANRAKNIKNKPRINEDPKDALLREFQEEVKRLKALLEGRGPVDDITPASGGDDRVQELEVKLAQMQRMFEEERSSRDRLEKEIMRLRNTDANTAVTTEDGGYGYGDIAPEENGEQQAQQQPILDEDGNIIGMAPVAPPARRRIQTASMDIQTDATLMGEESAEVGRNGSGSSAANGFTVDGKPLKMTPSQVAVHLQSVSMTGPAGKAVKPSVAVPANNAGVAGGAGRADDITDADLQKEREIALQRLQELQGRMVGGESTQNTELKAKHEKKRKAAEDRRRKVAEALANGTDEDIMIGIYEDLHDEIRANAKQTVKEKQNAESLLREINDIQSEFQTERADYLDTIRKHEREIKYLNALVMKIQPLIRRDCNYYNVDRIRSQSKWNEEDQNWALPPVLLPGPGGGGPQNPGDLYPSSAGGGFVPGPSGVAGLPNVATSGPPPAATNDDYDSKDEEYRRHLEERIAASDSYSGKWKQSRRREAILQEARVTQQLGADMRSKPPSRLEPLSSRQASALGMQPRANSRRF